MTTIKHHQLPPEQISVNPDDEIYRRLRAFQPHREVLSLMSQIGASPNILFGDGTRPLNRIISYMDRDEIGYSIAQANIPFRFDLTDANGNLPLHIAVRRNLSPDFVSYLVKNYPQGVEQQNNLGETPRHLAREHACQLLNIIDAAHFRSQLHNSNSQHSNSRE